MTDQQIEKYYRRQDRILNPINKFFYVLYPVTQVGLFSLFLFWIFGFKTLIHMVLLTLAVIVSVTLILGLITVIFSLWHRKTRMFLYWENYPIQLTFKEYVRIQRYHSFETSFYTLILLSVVAVILFQEFGSYSYSEMWVVGKYVIGLIFLLGIATWIAFAKAKDAFTRQKELQERKYKF